MNKKLMAAVLVVFIVGAIGGNFIAQFFVEQPPEPSAKTKSLIGNPMPEFSMLGLDGVREHSTQWQGKPLVVNFWATWCAPCKREIPALIELWLHVIGQSPESAPQ